MAEPKRRMFRRGTPFGLPAMQQRRPGFGQAMPRPSRAAGRGWFPSATGRRGATPAWPARGRRGATTMRAEFAGGRAGLVRDKTDTGGMRVKPAWALIGWFRIPIIGPWIEALANMVFKYRRFEQTEQQSVGFAGKKGRLVPAEERPMSPDDVLRQALVPEGKTATGRKAFVGPRGAGRRASAMQGTHGQRAIAGQRSAGRRQMKQAA